MPVPQNILLHPKLPGLVAGTSPAESLRATYYQAISRFSLTVPKSLMSTATA